MQYLLVAIFPFFLLLLLMIILKKPAYVAAPVTLVLTLITTYFIWEMDTLWFMVALIRGFFVTVEILFIVFGAVFLLTTMQKAHIFKPIHHILEGVSKDRRVQAILVAWFLVSFIEGAAGFGTPAMIAAPILVLIGFKPLVAVAISLVGESTAVTFGAMGVPITIGIADGLTSVQTQSLGNFIPQVAKTTALFHLAVGSFIPLAISVLVTYLVSKNLSKGFEIWKYAVFAGLAFTFPSFIIASVLGPEFPSILGALIGLSIVVPLTKRGFLLPSEVWRFDTPKDGENSTYLLTKSKLFKVVLPYILLLLLLVVSRVEVLGINTILQKYKIGPGSILGTSASHQLAPLYSPGFFLLLVSFYSFFHYKLRAKAIKNIVSTSVQKITLPFWSLFFILFLVNIMIFSSNNAVGLPSIPVFLAEEMRHVGSLWPLFAPFVGLTGTFITGSLTVSNLLFSAFQVETAFLYGFSPILILSLQAAGGAAGNTIAVHNVLAALTVVGLSRGEGEVIKQCAIPAFLYALCIGIIGLIVSLI